MKLDLRVAIGKYLRSTGEYVVNRVGAIKSIGFELWHDHDWQARECLSESRLVIEFDYWDAGHTHSIVIGHVVDEEEMENFLSILAEHK